MRVSGVVLLAVLSVGLVANKCKNKKEDKKNEAKEQVTPAKTLSQRGFYDKAQDSVEDYPDSLIFRVQRDACFGTCPVDITEIYKGGYLVYTPMMHGVRDSISFARVSEEEIQVLYLSMHDINFFELPDSYDAQIPDLPGLRLYVKTEEGKSKEINVKSGTPEDLRPMLNRFGFLLKNIEDWQDLK